ncbi:MAG: glycosyltransferase family 2 protein [bacterium]|nr:glycosyltransferase family 2 protein [bacterium]
MSSTAQRLAVIVPLKDEAQGLSALTKALVALRQDLADVADVEFVLVDDGSSDATWAGLGEFCEPVAGGGSDADDGRKPWATRVRHEQNRGLSAAIRTGIGATDAAICASIDGDLSYDPQELRPMLARFVDGVDVVTASPYHPDGAVAGVPGWRLLLSRTLSRCYRLLLRSEIRTWTSCFRVYRRDRVARLLLKEDGFLGTAELLIAVLRRGGRVVEHPCTLGVRQFGASKMRILRTILGHLRLLLRTALVRS